MTIAIFIIISQGARQHAENKKKKNKKESHEGEDPVLKSLLHLGHTSLVSTLQMPTAP